MSSHDTSCAEGTERRAPREAHDPCGPPGAGSARAWVEGAIARCLLLHRRVAERYARHLRRARRWRDPTEDVLVLAARRLAPLRRRVLRPLPGSTLPASARAFNALERADREALLQAWRAGAASVREARGQSAARGEHQASALTRLVEGTQRRQARELAGRARAGDGEPAAPRPPP